MIIQAKTVLKEFFETGDKPTQQQYWSLIDSLRHVHDKIPLIDLEEDVVSQTEFQNHLDDATFNGNVTIKGNDLNFLGSTTDWKMYTSGDNLYIRETALGDRINFTAGGGNTFYHQDKYSRFDSSTDYSIKVTSSDPWTGIAFQDTLGTGYLYYHGTTGYTLDNDLAISGNDSQFTIRDFNQSNVDIGDTQSAILLTGMYASGSTDSVYSQAKLRLVKDQADGTAGSAFAIDVMNNAGGASVLTERFVIDSDGNFDFKTGAASFGGDISADGIATFSNVASNWVKIDGGVNGTNDAAIYARGNTLRIQNDDSNFGNGDISIEADGDTYITSDLNLSVLKANNSADFRIKNQGDSSIAIFNNDLSSTFAGNITAPNLLGDVIGSQFTAGSSNGSVQIRNNAGQPIATFSDSLNSSFSGDISLKNDKFLYLGDSNNARLFANSTNTFFDGLTGNMYFRNQSDGGKMYFQVESLSGDDMDLIEIHGDTQDVLLRHANSSRLQTTSEGVNVYGELSVVKSGAATPHADTDLFVADSSAAISYGQVEVLGGNNGASYLYFSDTDNYAVGGVKYSHANDNMTFRVNNHDLIELGDSKLFLGRNSTTGQVRIDYKKDANNSNGWYTGYLSGSNTDNNFGVYGYESDGDYRIYTNNNLALSINTSQDASFYSGITATGAISSNAGFSTGIQAANAGAIRLENGDAITSRNSANSGNRTLLYLDSSNVAQFSLSTDSIFGGKITNYGTLQINDDGGSGYTHSRIILDSGNNTRGAGIFSRGATHDWYWGNPYSEHDKAFIIAKAATGSTDAVAQYSNALFTLSETGIKIPTSVEISRSGWNTYSIQQSAGNGLQFYDITADNSTMYLVDDKVGINNTAPTVALDVTGEVKATSFTQTGADVYTTISQLNASTSRFFADANLQIEAGASANILFLTNGAERARIDLNGLMTLNNDLTVTGDVNASDFIGDWNGKTNADYVSISGDETISGLKTFTNDVDIIYDKVKFYADPIPEGNPGSGFSTNLEGSITASYGEGLLMDSDLKVTGDLLAEGNINTDGGLGVDTDLNVGGDAFISQNISAGSYSVALSTPPSSTSSTGATGDIKYSTDHIYVCVATDTWKRVALATW